MSYGDQPDLFGSRAQPALTPWRSFGPQSRALGISGLIAAIVGCGIPLLGGVLAGWSPLRLLSYSLLALSFVVVTSLNNLPGFAPAGRSLPPWLFLLSMGLVALLLQTISGDPLIQPLIFTIPLVSAAMCYSAARTALVGAWYLGLIALGLWLSGQRDPAGLLVPVAAYGTLMIFMYAFTRMGVEQVAARERADALAEDLARERDYLARLVNITATLTHELDVTAVLEQVATAGRTLAHAAQASVWLREAETGDQPAPLLRLAAAVPALAAEPVLTAAAEQALLASEPVVGPSLLRLPLLFKQDLIGSLELRAQPEQPFSAADAHLLQPFVDAATIAIANARLYEQVRLTATLAERNRLGRELHDTIAQGLTAVSMQLAAAQRGFERDPARVHARLERAATLTRETLEQVRRSVWMLAEPVIEGEALTVALDELTTRFARRSGLSAHYRHEGPPPALGHTAATQLLRIVQEALRNVEKHAQAATVVVASRGDGSTLRISVRDDGRGFDPATLPAPGAAGPSGAGFGLLSLRERARLAGGTLEIESAPGVGTVIAVTLDTER